MKKRKINYVTILKICITIVIIILCNTGAYELGATITKTRMEQQMEAIEQEAQDSINIAYANANEKAEAIKNKQMKDLQDNYYHQLEVEAECIEDLKYALAFAKKAENKELADAMELLILRHKSSVIMELDEKMDIEVPELYKENINQENVDEDILEYVLRLGEIVEKYKLSSRLNSKVIIRLESIEEKYQEQIKKNTTLVEIWSLKAQCEDNINLWNY